MKEKPLRYAQGVFLSFPLSAPEHHLSDATLDQRHRGPCRCSAAGGLGQRQAAILQGSGTTRSCHLTQKENPGNGQHWPVGAAAAPGSRSAQSQASLSFPAALFCASRSAVVVGLVPSALILPPMFSPCAVWRRGANEQFAPSPP